MHTRIGWQQRQCTIRLTRLQQWFYPRRDTCPTCHQTEVCESGGICDTMTISRYVVSTSWRSQSYCSCDASHPNVCKDPPPKSIHEEGCTVRNRNQTYTLGSSHPRLYDLHCPTPPPLSLTLCLCRATRAAVCAASTALS